MQLDNVVRQNCLVPIEKVETSFSLRNNKIHPSIQRTQFLLILSWVCIVNKVRGMSLDEGIISFNLKR